MSWSRVPTSVGLWWVWQPADVWPCKGKVHLVEVSLEYGALCAWVPYMDFSETITTAQDDTWGDSWWLGPVDAPKPPQ